MRTLIMLNPRRKRGAVYRMQRDGVCNVVHMSAFSHPNVISGNNLIPGAVDRNTTVRRIAQMCRPMTDDESAVQQRADDVSQFGGDVFRLPPFLAGCVPIDQKNCQLEPLKEGYYVVKEPSFCHMVMGTYSGRAVNQLIHDDWIAAARNRWDVWVGQSGCTAPVGAEGVAGLDVGEFGSDPSALCYRYAGGYVHHVDLWRGLDPLSTAERAMLCCRKKSGIVAIMVDGNGVGSGVAPIMMRQGVAARSVKTQEGPDDREVEPEFGEFKILRDQLAWQLREWLRTDPTSMLPPDEELLEELRIIAYNTDGRYVRVMTKGVIKDNIGRSPNKFDALCLTFAKRIDIGLGMTQGVSVSQHRALMSKYHDG